MTPRKEIIMKKIISVFFAMFIIFVMTLPAFAATECEHVINYPAEIVDNSIEGLEVYACSKCNEKVYQCNNCHKAVSLEELHCTNCSDTRVAINSEEENLLKEESDNAMVFCVLAIFTVGFICAICFILLMI